jgi:uncharacterized cupin superfamily protein
MNDAIVLEQQITSARLNELGVHGWPTWKDGVGTRVLSFDAAEKSYLLDGSATLSLEDGVMVDIQKGDLVIIPAGKCQWVVHSTVRRHYRSEALSPACCII